MIQNKTPLVAVAGPTASGKTALAVELAIRFGGEVVGADSMQIYRGMNIATAKPTAEEMRGIRHHLIDFCETSEDFSVADYVKLAKSAIKDINSRKKLAILCGGTGLYIDSLIENTKFDESENNAEIRPKLKALAEQKGNAYLLSMLREIDPQTAERLHENNLNRIIRAIEIYQTTGRTMSEQIKLSRTEGSPYEVCMLCLDYKDRGKLYERIDKRVDKMLEEGLIDEARAFYNDGSLKTSRQAIGYKELDPYFSGSASLEDCIASLKQSTRRYAKRQLTWFRRYAGAHRLYPDDYRGFNDLADEAERIVSEFLNGSENV